MYFAYNPDDTDKFSAKGIKAKTNELSYEKFYSALYKDESEIASNVSIRYRNEKIQTMEVRKIGLKNLSKYAKNLETKFSSPVLKARRQLHDFFLESEEHWAHLSPNSLSAFRLFLYLQMHFEPITSGEIVVPMEL